MSEPRVSVAMAVLNPHPKYFRQAVESVLAQSLPDFELIIIEEPSASSAAAILTPLRDVRIRHVLHPQRTSLIEQRNRGLDLAQSDLVAIFDADDICEPERLMRQFEFMRSNPEIGVLGSRIVAIDEADQPVGIRRYPLSHEAIVAALPLYNPIAQPSVMFRKHLVQSCGGYRYARHPMLGDYELWSRMAKQNVRFTNLEEPLLRYRIHPAGSKSAELRASIRGTIDIKLLHWSGAMSAKARARLWAERALLCLPPSLVLRMFTRMNYRPSRVRESLGN
jgi:glycosyltransferase involved in cell wall biosynthesis